MFVSQVRTSTSWIVTWAVLGVLPLVAYAAPLVRFAAADTPLAYLVWVVPIALVWAVDNLRRLPAYRAEPRTSAALGGLLLAVVAAALVLAPRLWPFTFQADDLALLAWPLGLLALAWLWFGPAVTPSLAAPLAFLWLAWPPLLATASARASATLLVLAHGVLSLAAGLMPNTLVVGAGPAYGLGVAHSGHVVALSLTAACSGADGLIAALILLPFLLSRCEGSLGRRLLLVFAAALLAVVLNLARVAVLLVLVGRWGPAFALSWPHAVLGLALFFILGAILARLAAAWRLLPIEAPPGDDAIVLPTPARTVAGGSGLLLAALVALPGAIAPPGALGVAVPVQTLAAVALLPRLPGRPLRVLADPPAQPALAAAAPAAAAAYTLPGGGSVTARLWLTPSLQALGPYAYAACLACGAAGPAAARDLTLAPDTPARAYLLWPHGRAGRPALDVEWTEAVVWRGRLAYLHAALTATGTAAPFAPAAAGAGPGAPRASWLFARLPAPVAGSLPAAVVPVWRRLVPFAQGFEHALDAGVLL